MKPIYGIKVPGTKIKIRKENKVYFCALISIFVHNKPNIPGFGFSSEI